MKNLIKKITVGTVLGAMILGTTVFAFADDSTISDFCTGEQVGKIAKVNKGSGSSNYFMNGNHGKASKGHVFDEYVELGIISQDEADAISEYFTAKKEADMTAMSSMTIEEKKAYIAEKKQGADGTTLFDELVAEGIINQEQVAKMETAKQDKMQALAKEKHANLTNNWVEEGIITTEEAEAISNYLTAKHEAMQAATANMTPAEKKTYHMKNRPAGSLTDELVAEGLISSEQAEEIGTCIGNFNKNEAEKAKMHKGMGRGSNTSKGKK